jgi:hypothetical protein
MADEPAPSVHGVRERDPYRRGAMGSAPVNSG